MLSQPSAHALVVALAPVLWFGTAAVPGSNR